MVDSNYATLRTVFDAALQDASEGKGKERHATPEQLESQVSPTIEKWGLGYCLGQAVKKIVEYERTGVELELLGALNYIGMKLVVEQARAKEGARARVPRWELTPDSPSTGPTPEDGGR